MHLCILWFSCVNYVPKRRRKKKSENNKIGITFRLSWWGIKNICGWILKLISSTLNLTVVQMNFLWNELTTDNEAGFFYTNPLKFQLKIHNSATERSVGRTCTHNKTRHCAIFSLLNMWWVILYISPSSLIIFLK